ncbi:MAG: 2-oxoacid:acceptor oxidoreductase subunit alpha [Candidatus Shikimatogenerans sp. Tduv]|uniref:2-oxoacid:acceptor oxidoreductase subunit alpha n=1 Tax=Candidatus Shikimatogenerans sp. Tduv TaxID=3158567 RepID=A0AAU7QTN1_9FLAO
MINILISGISGDGIQYISKKIIKFISYNINKKYYIYTHIEYPSDIKNPFLKKDNLSNFFIIITKKKYYNINNIKIDLLIINNCKFLKTYKRKCKKKSIIFLLKNRHFIKKKYKNKKYIYYFNTIKYSNNLLIKFNLLNQKIYIRNYFIFSIIIKIFNFKKKKFLNYIKYNKYFNIIKKIFYLGIKYIKIYNIFKIKKKYNININILNGNNFLIKGLIDASKYLKLKIFFSYYPITPATNISKYLYKKNINVFKSEDEIASIYNCIGASYVGNIAITSTSGPGMSLMQEGIGLAIVLELPILIINVQRCGPSTGIPTLFEQSDLLLSLYGRHGESILPVYSIKSPIDSYYIAYKSLILSVKYSTPIIILSDFNIANNYNRCFYKKKYINIFNIKDIYYKNFFIKKTRIKNKKYLCLSGLEQNYNNNKISYNIDNHFKNIIYREKKINNFIKKYKFNILNKNYYILIITWGSIYYIIKYYILLYNKKYNNILSYIHIKCIYPLNYNFINNFFSKFKLLLFIENNNKQLYNIIYHKNKIFYNYYIIINNFFNIINNLIKKY